MPYDGYQGIFILLKFNIYMYVSILLRRRQPRSARHATYDIKTNLGSRNQRTGVPRFTTDCIEKYSVWREFFYHKYSYFSAWEQWEQIRLRVTFTIGPNRGNARFGTAGYRTRTVETVMAMLYMYNCCFNGAEVQQLNRKYRRQISICHCKSLYIELKNMVICRSVAVRLSVISSCICTFPRRLSNQPGWWSFELTIQLLLEC